MLPLNENLICLDVEAKTPVEAIRKAGALLMDEGKVEERYVDAMVEGFNEFGPYMAVAPSIAIPHARPEQGVLEQSLALIRLKNPVFFGHHSNDPIKLVCAVCGTDGSSHTEILQSLAAVLRDRAKLEMIMQAKTKADIMSILF
ncbi:PTS sugar transporter subunit IIA [Bacillus canaveralius]|uniref:PTS sugar transporter subunit IIA n=2 Tax=Bacillus canaveralius TaxID=1403243 RepID=A0A2N5GQR4_9BACI|nr:PTS sugar transporter subunit IIA [Bacillus sp. V33-4]PLR85157.1 PTS sugar transporter subunit IIA [Bacillus sp. V33-4]PLR85403.1 PTS sugar transporter subunit IIA [Bacillus canaveralius]PLR94962.1 PTS sugar transporter subunit IIA [Bacillus canaveralius]RSK48165.1 PTS sugar transporter subunit IIA [Bacillus canaveralius]